MIFHFEMSSNDVRRNTDFVVVLSSPFNNTSKPIYENNFRRAIAFYTCLLYTSPSPRDVEESRMPSSA